MSELYVCKESNANPNYCDVFCERHNKCDETEYVGKKYSQPVLECLMVLCNGTEEERYEAEAKLDALYNMEVV